jgi:hypothetical protein
MSALHRTIRYIQKYPGLSLYLAACAFVPLQMVGHFVNQIIMKYDYVSLAYTIVGLLGVAVLLGAVVFQKVLVALAPPTVMICTFCPLLALPNNHTAFNDAVIYSVLALFIVAVVARIFALFIVAFVRWVFPRGVAPTLVSLGLVVDTHTNQRF